MDSAHFWLGAASIRHVLLKQFGQSGCCSVALARSVSCLYSSVNDRFSAEATFVYLSLFAGTQFTFPDTSCRLQKQLKCRADVLNWGSVVTGLVWEHYFLPHSSVLCQRWHRLQHKVCQHASNNTMCFLFAKFTQVCWWNNASPDEMVGLSGWQFVQPSIAWTPIAWLENRLTEWLVAAMKGDDFKPLWIIVCGSYHFHDNNNMGAFW